MTDKTIRTLSTGGAVSDSDLLISRQGADVEDVSITATQLKTYVGTDYVPYTGATGNVDLGANSLTVDTNTLFVDSINNRVGVGTDNPLANLHVTGAANPDMRVEATGTNATAYSSIMGTGTGDAIQRFSTAGTFRWSVGVDSSAGNDFIFSNTFNLGAPALVLEGTTRNVGIGTASPDDVLHVVKSGDTVLKLQSAQGEASNTYFTRFVNKYSASNPFYMEVNSYGQPFGLKAGLGGSTTTPYVGGYYGLALTSGNTNSPDISHVRLFVEQAGNVGVGTTTPRSKLSVYDNVDDTPTTLTIENGDTTIETAQQVNNIDFYTNDASTSGTGVSARISQIAENAGNQYSLAFSTYSLSLQEAMRIDQSGQVGIGTTDPAQVLHIVEPTNPTIRLNETATPNSYFEIGHQGPTQTTLDAVNNDAGSALIDFNPLPSDGTSTASFRFFRATNTAGTVGFSIHAGDGTATTNSFLGGNTNSYFNTASGNVGIGTVSPSHKLDVNSDSIRLRTAKTPASAAATGTQGEIAWDADYIYICTATNTWKRSALTTW